MPSITRRSLRLLDPSSTSFSRRSNRSPPNEAGCQKAASDRLAAYRRALIGDIELQEGEDLMASIRYCTAEVDGFNVFYREAGNKGASKLLLLHGFPSAGHMFRDLIPLLANRFHMIAPDLPGFGQSD